MPASSAPKPPGQRRRRNTGQSQWRELPAAGRAGAPPDLPGGEWLDSTFEWWATIWGSPMATVWQPADVDGLVRLAQLRDAQHRGELPVSALGAIQNLEDRFGLNPKGRRMLQWEVSQASGEVIDLPTPKRGLRAIEA